MSGAERPDRAAQDERLRRNLYRPGAGEQDVVAYRRTRTAASAPIPRAAAGAGASSSRPRRRRWPVPVAVAATAALVAAALVLLRQPDAPPPPRLPLTAADRAELVANLADGGAAGIAAVLLTHPSPPALRGAGRLVTAEVHGEGDAIVRLDAPDVPDGAGRATVLVVLERGGAVTWTALRLGTAGSPAVVLRPVASRTQQQAAGVLTTTTVRYPAGRRPVRLRVDVDGDAAWGAAVVFSD